MRYYPIFVNLENRIVVVVGGGPVSERKILSLIEAGANVVLISPVITDKLKKLADSRQIHYIPRPYQSGDLKGASLVIAATDSPETNLIIVKEADSLSLFANHVNSSDHSTFIVPSVVTKKDLQIAISTSGQSPALTKQIRQKLEKEFGPEYDLFIDLLSQVRRLLHKKAFPEEIRGDILNKLAESDILDLLKMNEKEKALAKTKEISKLNEIKL